MGQKYDIFFTSYWIEIMKTTALHFLDNFLCLFTIQIVGCQIWLGLSLCQGIKSTQRGCHNYPKRNKIQIGKYLCEVTLPGGFLAR